MKKIIYIIGGLFVFGLIARMCSSGEKVNEKFEDESKNFNPISDQKTKDSLEAIPKTRWVYSDDTDKMTNKVNYFATIVSNEPVDLEFPYDKGSKGIFTIRKMDGRLGAVLTVSGSQFTSDVYGGNVSIKFDEEAGRTYSFSGASDGSSDVIFINNTKLLIQKLKKAKTMLIEAEFYSNGNKIMEFDVSNFEWKH